MGFDHRSRGHLVMGLPRDAFRPSPIFLTLVGLFAASGVMAWYRLGNVKVDVFLFVVSGWLVSLCLHEYAHALFAYRSGDVAVAQRGYLRLDPLKYSHPLLSIVFPVLIVVLGGIGLPGGAVWVDRHAIPGRLRHSLISAAGPLMNVLFVLVLTMPFVFGLASLDHLEFWAAVAFLGFLQLTASLLNLLPVPGLDGGNVLQPWLSAEGRRGYDMMAPYGFLLLFVLLWSERIGGWFFSAVFTVADAIGLPSSLYGVGYQLMRFWS